MEKISEYLGAHLSISKGLHKAVYAARELGCNSLQIFTKNAMAWKEKILTNTEINLFNQAKKNTGIRTILSHTSYLINLASDKPEIRRQSQEALKLELLRSASLAIPYVVMHPGAHMGQGEEAGIKLISESVNDILLETGPLNTRLLFETTAGQGTGLGYTFEQLSVIIKKIDQKRRVGICLDTCHIFAAGYDIRTEDTYKQTIDCFDSIVGIENLFAFHLNDSKKGLASRVDRHEHIGMGTIGRIGFECLMNDIRFRDIPMIIETPKRNKGGRFDQFNLEKLRSLVKK